jgi:hypothetical protein
MPGFPCDNSGGDFIPDEMYDGVRDTIRTQRQKLGRPLTEEEIAEIYISEGLEPPREGYCGGRTYVDYGFNMEEFEEEIYDEVRGKVESKTKELGRYLTEEELEGCFIAEGIEPPLNCYEDAYGDDEGEEGYVRIKFEPKTNQPDEDKLGNSNQEQASTPQTSFEEDDSILNRAFVRRYIHTEKLLKEKNLKTRRKKKQANQTDAPIKINHESSKNTENQTIEVSPNHAEENESEDSSQSETIKVPFSEEALRELEADSPLAAEYWRGLQAIAQEHGINSTFTIRKKPPSATKKVRFVFLEKGTSPTDSEAKPSK